MALGTLSRSVAGSVALVTGAAGGIGRATAHVFADAGVRLALVDRDAGGLEAVREEVAGEGAEVTSSVADLTDRSAVERVVGESVGHFGGLDILVNNAGLALLSAIDGEDYEHSWNVSMALMADAQAWAVRAALPALRRAEHPRIVNLASTEALGATALNSAYVAAKHASLGLTRALAVELGKEGITVNAVCPGPVRTGITAAIPEGDKLVFARRRTALRRYAVPEEIAHAILHLVLPASGFITGAALVVDGGLTIRNA